MTEKEKIRADIKKMRAALTKDDVRARSEAILHQLLKTESYAKAGWLFAYMSFKNEADTRQLILEAFKAGKRVAVPKVTGKHRMIFYEINALSDVREGAMGILEPSGGMAVIPGKTVGFSEILMLVPGLAFDKGGRRLGWGGGFYDAYLAGYEKLMTAGIGYDFQIYPSLPQDALDQAVDMIVTEKEVIMPFGY